MNDRATSRPSAWAYVFVFAIIYISQDTLLFGTNSNTLFDTILYISMPVLIVGVFAYGCTKNAPIQTNVLAATAVMCVLTLATLVFAEGSMNPKYFYGCMMYILAFLICTVIPARQFRRVFADIMAGLALFSLAAFAIRYVYPGITQLLPTVVNVNGYQYGNMLFAMIPHDVAYVTFRNYGIFREPGVYQIFLNLALLFLLEDRKEHKPWKLYATVLALVFTFSTAAYIIFGVIVLVNLLTGKIKFSVRLLWQVALAAAVVGYLFVNGIIRYDSAIFTKLFSANASLNSRMGSVLVDWHMGMQSPILGNGFEYVEKNFGLTALNLYGLTRLSNTNTILKMFAVYGFVKPCMFLLGTVLFCKKNLAKKAWLLYVTVFVLLLSNEDIIFNTIIYIIMIYGFMNEEVTENDHALIGD